MLNLSGGNINGVPVLFTPITHQNIEKLKRIQHSALYPKQKICYFPAYSPILTFILKDVKAVFGGHKLDEKAEQIVKNYQEFMALYKKKYLRSDFKMVYKSFNHQTESLLDIIYNFRWNLSLDPGLGKTKIIIDYLRYLTKTALVVAPSSLLENWIDEFGTHSFGELEIAIFADDVKAIREQVFDEEGNKVRDEKGKLKKRTIPAKVVKTQWLKDLKTDVLLIGYDSAQLYADEIAAHFKYDIMVLDESHRIKSFKGKNSVAIRKLGQNAYRRVTMSGTYILNSPVDAWPQLDFLSPQILNQPYYTFQKNYCNFHPDYRHQVVGFKNMDKANKIIGRFSTRYTKEDAVDMPKRTVIPVHYELSTEQLKWYDDILSEDDLIFDDGNITKDHKVTLLGKLAQLCKGYIHLSNKDPNICDGCTWMADCVENGIKPYTKPCNVEKKAPAPTKRRMKSNPAMNALMSLLEDILEEPTHKAIVWARGVEELEMLSEMFTKSKIGFTRITDAKTTISKVRYFNETPEQRILLSSVATGIGYTANSAEYSIYYSVDFSLEHYLQSRDRNYRLNTPHPVFEYHLVAKNTIDEPTFEALKFKKSVVDTLLANVDCNMCPHKKHCADNGIAIFSKGCKFKAKVNKTTIKV